MSEINIVVPAYNAEKYIAATLESIRRQTYPGWELIVVDDGSGDKTANVVRSYAKDDPRIRLFEQPNQGVSAARMAGVEKTNRALPFLTFIDADDTWEPHALETLRATLVRDTQAVGAHGLACIVDADGQQAWPGAGEQYGRDRHAVYKDRLVAWPPARPTTFEVLAFRNYIYTSGQVLLRREAFEASGGYPVESRGAEDWELWLQLTSGGHLAFVDRVVLNYRRHGASIAADAQLMAREKQRVRRGMLCAPWLNDDQRRIFRTASRLDLQFTSRQRWKWACESITKGDMVGGIKEVRRALVDAMHARGIGTRRLS